MQVPRSFGFSRERQRFADQRMQVDRTARHQMSRVEEGAFICCCAGGDTALCNDGWVLKLGCRQKAYPGKQAQTSPWAPPKASKTSFPPNKLGSHGFDQL